jgi:hypothetical protein
MRKLGPVKKLFLFLYNTAAVTGLLLALVAIVGTVFISYRSLDRIAESRKTLQEISQKLASFNAVDVIERDLTSTAVPSLCKILCDQSHFDFAAAQGPARDNPLLYLNEFYKQVRRPAFADPKFRLALETAIVYSNLVSASARQALSEVSEAAGHVPQMSEMEKLAFSTKLPVLVLKEGAQLATLFGDIQVRANRVNEMTRLRESCTQGKPQDVIQECGTY